MIRLEGETLLGRTIRIAREAGCDPVIVVLGASAPLIRQTCELTATVVVLNEHWHEGMASSIRLGISTASEGGAAAAIVLPCDMPSITPGHLLALQSSGRVTASRYGERSGIPAFFPSGMFAALMTLTGDTGARDLLRRAPSIMLAEGEWDIDTPADAALLIP